MIYQLKKIVDVIINKLLTGRGSLEPAKKLYLLKAQLKYVYTMPKNLQDLPQDIQNKYASVLTEDLYLPERGVLEFYNIFVNYQRIIFKNFKVSLPSINHFSLLAECQNTFLLKQRSDDHLVVG